MDTINISLPSQLKNQADALIKQGYFASFSDLVRTALRKVLLENTYDTLALDAVRDYQLGKTKALRTKKDIDVFLEDHMT